MVKLLPPCVWRSHTFWLGALWKGVAACGLRMKFGMHWEVYKSEILLICRQIRAAALSANPAQPRARWHDRTDVRLSSIGPWGRLSRAGSSRIAAAGP